MGREMCDRNEQLAGKTFCDYFDLVSTECAAVHLCPNGLDDDDEEEQEEGEDEYLT